MVNHPTGLRKKNGARISCIEPIFDQLSNIGDSGNRSFVYREGAGKTNGWGDDLGLARLPEKVKPHMIRDISLFLKG